ncbi:protein translocase subunit SecD [Longimicrobium sp.]|uniref:protein translocase subunit SecD n=1 Tax=Longimicrobium sp. TaxID=2029185 RepID=UPI002C63C416|nr:protein translocase subunit SecD [Longimicrobium sp.]HSU16320.1 protein translocase subunit SecD [Longimicrobium sp.]
MFQNLKVRLGLIVALTIASLALLAYRYNKTGQPITLGLDLQGGSHYAMEIDESRTVLTPAARRDAIDRALKVVRLRVDELGVSEPVVQKAGEDRIIVELAGKNTDQSRAKEVLQKSAFLEFKIVRPLSELQGILPRMETAIAAAFPAEAKPAAGAAPATGGLLQNKAGQNGQAVDSLTAAKPLESKFAGQGSGGQLLVDTAQVKAVEKYLALPQVQALLPRGAQFLWGMPSSEEQKGFASLWYVSRDAIMTGEHLQNAQAQTDQFNRPIVAFELSRRAGRRFEKETGDHLHEQMAIVLDQRVYTAPVINGAINTRGQIELGKSTMADASDLALVLRAGALPAPLHIVEERSVGPSLGEDSIRNGQIAALVGIGAVILIMIGIYHFSGLLAVVALAIYVIVSMGMLALLGATLTFPGIAGLILSVGMAVDANVLIFERIREELDHGRSVRAAVNEGFHHAMRAIVDSNVTTLITCAILFYTGTGPIRGFAVTLAVGVVASFFTAVFTTRTFMQLYLERRRAQSLSI